VARWITQEYAAASNSRSGINEHGFVDRATPGGLGSIIREAGRGAISMANAREVFRIHVETGQDPAAVIAERGYRQISDAGAIGAAVDEVIAANPAAVADYRAGKAQVLGFLVGQVMKATKGQANAAAAAAALRARLDVEAES
jgi:aspartyl-tRNA(Asn)/glutamyl-tRNA(Gln) amidotransferase subunit B